jgi:hypothetical protein
MVAGGKGHAVATLLSTMKSIKASVEAASSCNVYASFAGIDIGGGVWASGGIGQLMLMPASTWAVSVDFVFRRRAMASSILHSPCFSWLVGWALAGGKWPCYLGLLYLHGVS